MKNFSLRVSNIEREMERAGYDGNLFTFSNGDEITLTSKQVQAMFSDTIARKPNEHAAFFLERLKAGHQDENGLVYPLAAYAADPRDIWGDELDGTDEVDKK